MSIVQLAVIAAICLVCTAPNGIELPADPGYWVSVLYMALVAGALALLLQTWAQAHLPATSSAIIMTMEPIFAAFFAVLFGGEALTVRMAFGGALVLGAMLAVELAPGRRIEGEVSHLTV